LARRTSRRRGRGFDQFDEATIFDTFSGAPDSSPQPRHSHPSGTASFPPSTVDSALVDAHELAA
jgi:hypothetical protein